MEEYDVIIVGGGPAGLSAAIYAARYKLKTIVLSKTIGGLAATAHKICNFPVFKEIKGYELMQKFTDTVKHLNVPIKYDEVLKLEKEGDKFLVETKKEKIVGKKIIFALGTEHIKLGLTNEARLLGKGVSYCATCDAAFFREKVVGVVGGGDAALTAALLLSEYATKVYIIYRKPEFIRAEPSWVELVEKEKKIESLFNEEIEEIVGEDNLEKIKLKSGKEIEVEGLFMEIGSKPETELIDHMKIKKDNSGYIVIDKDQKTNIKGLYAAGDITNNNLKQIITASGEGAIAAFNCYKDLKKEQE